MFIIYALYYKNTPFYVGLTGNSLETRVKYHRHDAKRKRYRVSYKILKIWRNGEDFQAKILETGPTLSWASSREKFYIAMYREQGLDLCNLTDGGEGTSGVKCPEHLKQYYRELKLGKSWGRHSDETKKILSDLKRGKSFSLQHIKNLSIARRGRKISETQRLKASKTSKGKINIKIVTLIAPDGSEHVTKEGVTVFCEKNNLTQANLNKVIRGERPHHKNWRLKVDKTENSDI